ncbi:hypothetical protein, partial [Caballeronia grimmiae]|uniref:hypothetical protein n=1 Tax=Caballeronia grimmiae TaxID=1071679 RepID=UPI0019D33393
AIESMHMQLRRSPNRGDGTCGVFKVSTASGHKNLFAYPITDPKDLLPRFATEPQIHCQS